MAVLRFNYFRRTAWRRKGQKDRDGVKRSNLEFHFSREGGYSSDLSRHPLMQ
jgi:hypothetical protein